MSFEYSTTTHPAAEELAELFAQTDWARHRDADAVKVMAGCTPVFVAVRHNGVLVGYGRALSDGVFRALLDDIVVDKGCRGRGIGNRIVASLLEQLGGIDEVFLNTGPHLEQFYGRHGFKAFGGLTMVAESP